MSCNIKYEDQVNKAERPEKLTEQQEADKLGVTVSKVQAMKAYAAQLVRSDKKMKASTIRMKVCKKFNIKLV